MNPYLFPPILVYFHGGAPGSTWTVCLMFAASTLLQFGVSLIPSSHIEILEPGIIDFF